MGPGIQIGVTAVATAEPEDPAKFILKFPSDINPRPGHLWILATDYYNYTIQWACSEYNNQFGQSAWIQSRSPHNDPADVKKWVQMLAGFGFDVTRLSYDTQEGCWNAFPH